MTRGGPLSFGIRDSDFRRVAESLRRAGGELPGELRKAMKKAVRPVVARVRANARALAVHGEKHTGLRGRLAAAVRAQSSTRTRPGVRIVASLRDRDERSLPRYTDNGSEGWRHPVFGNRHVWVKQYGGSWFKEEIADSRAEISRALQQVLKEAADKVGRH